MSDAGKPSAPIGLAGIAAPGASAGGAAGGTAGDSAGAMLRAAREKRGLHIAALAASIKVSPRKLEALEADRYDELPDLTFTRALAQTVCRALKIDAEPVLAKLPLAGNLPKLARLGDGLNTRFREAPGRRDPREFGLLRKPVFWATLLVLLGALALALLPERWVPWRAAASGAARNAVPAAALAPAAPASATGLSGGLPAAVSMAASAVEAAASVVIETVQALPPEALAGPTAAGPPPATAGAAGILQLRSTAASWVEVQDARGTVLLSRSVLAGEAIGLDGALPLRLTIGNASAIQLAFRGATVDLSANTRDNVARLQLP